MAYRSSTRKTKGSKSGKPKVGRTALIAILVVSLVGVFALAGYYFFFAIAPPTPGTPTLEASTFAITDLSTDLDVSDDVNITVYFPINVSDVAGWDEDEYLDIDNYEANVTNEIASEVELDLAEIPVIFVEIETANGYANTFWLLGAGGNYDYTLWAGINSDDLLFIIIDEVYAPVNVSGHQTDGDYCIIYSITDYETSLQMPLYNPANDTLKDWDEEDPISLYTDCFAFQFVFNDTIELEEAAPTHVNFTLSGLSENATATIIIDDDSIFVVFYEMIGFTGIPKSLFYSIEYGADITLIDVDAVRVFVPSDSTGAITPTKISDIAF